MGLQSPCCWGLPVCSMKGRLFSLQLPLLRPSLSPSLPSPSIDFTILRGLMFCVLFVFILFGFLISIFAVTGGNIRIINLVYAAIGVLIFSVYLVIDTQMMMGGHKFSISPEEYVFAAIAIYLDILNLF